ncbi:hypothetical protein [Pseudonocardia broussonetiae]|uniref:STAS domain-containing protein n=1 Tax=Pseudonocardia broussonetiae TaxID=2736640 RepID=A0A6M6JP34_9PSEU|nr:hypothetical protein [Pseudonocardia broussonetiae]QJY48993.1 hypothetical protein HOP40_27085 [Pseudonocardia broussonetiae]
MHVDPLLGSGIRVHLPTLALSVAVLTVLVLVGAFLPRLPGPLLAVLLATAASVVLDLPGHGVSVVGAVRHRDSRRSPSRRWARRSSPPCCCPRSASPWSCDELRSRGVPVALARAEHELLEDLGRLGLRERTGEDRIFPTLPTAVEAYRRESACP